MVPQARPSRSSNRRSPKREVAAERDDGKPGAKARTRRSDDRARRGRVAAVPSDKQTKPPIASRSAVTLPKDVALRTGAGASDRPCGEGSTGREAARCAYAEGSRDALLAQAARSEPRRDDAEARRLMLEDGVPEHDGPAADGSRPRRSGNVTWLAAPRFRNFRTMLSVANVRTAGGAANYFAADNYYTRADADRSGEWLGKGAAEARSDGRIEAKQFEAVLKGFLPDGSRVGSDNRSHRAGTDLTFSMPKSWSILALVGGDKRILDAYADAVRETLALGGKEPRRDPDGRGGQGARRSPTGNLVDRRCSSTTPTAIRSPTPTSMRSSPM